MKKSIKLQIVKLAMSCYELLQTIERRHTKKGSPGKMYDHCPAELEELGNPFCTPAPYTRESLGRVGPERHKQIKASMKTRNV